MRFERLLGVIAPSIRARLLLGLVLPMVVFMAVDAWANYRSAIRTAQLAYDRLLVTSAHAIADLIRLERGKLVIGLPHAALEIYNQPTTDSDQTESRGRMLYRVGFIDGTYLAGDVDLTPYAGRPVSHPLYHSMMELYDTNQGEEPMRVAALLQPVESFDGTRLLVVQVAESSRYRNALTRSILLDTLARQAILLAVLLALLWGVATLALKPLNVLAKRLDDRPANDLTPLELLRPPLEIRSLLGGFNGLLSRLAQAQQQQRRFIADASHQLRTPLSVLQLQADAGLRNDIPALEALASIATTAQRATRLAEQLLSLTRAHQTTHSEAPQPCDLRELVTEVAVELSPMMAAKFLDFHFDCLTSTVTTHHWMVREVIGNLLKNAIEFTPIRGMLGLRLETSPTPIITVWDTGPGLSPAMKEHVFTPFATDRPSTGAGLGLAICNDLAKSFGATVVLTNGSRVPHGGLEARLVFAPE